MKHKYEVSFTVESDEEWSASAVNPDFLVNRDSSAGLSETVRVPRYAEIKDVTPVPVGSVYRNTDPENRSYVWVMTHVGWVAVDLKNGEAEEASVVTIDLWLSPHTGYEAL